MAQVLLLQVLNLNPRPLQPRIVSSTATQHQNWISLQQQLQCNGRFSCLFSNNRKEEQARKALDSALGGKKNEFEKWNNEIKKREEVGGGTDGGGGGGGGGGWFGWGRWFGWYDGGNFWREAQQAILAVIGIIFMYLVIAKGEVMLALIFNPLLYGLRGTRKGITSIIARIMPQTSFNNHANINDLSKTVIDTVSAKERVVKKWGTD